MGTLHVFNHITLDGVMQAPAAADEDTRDGFDKGGWAADGNDDQELAAITGESMSHSGALLLGRRTYEHFCSFWPKQKDNPFTDVLNKAQKYVVSRTLTEPLPWENSTLLNGDVAARVKEVKQSMAKDLVVLGSGDLLTTLMAADLVDTYTLIIHPVVLGTGRRMLCTPAELTLDQAVPTKRGLLIATYRREADTV